MVILKDQVLQTPPWTFKCKNYSSRLRLPSWCEPLCVEIGHDDGGCSWARSYTITLNEGNFVRSHSFPTLTCQFYLLPSSLLPPSPTSDRARFQWWRGPLVGRRVPGTLDRSTEDFLTHSPVPFLGPCPHPPYHSPVVHTAYLSVTTSPRPRDGRPWLGTLV